MFTALVIAAGMTGVAVLFDMPDKKFDGSHGGALSFLSASARTKNLFVREWRLLGAATKRPNRIAGPKDLGAF